MAATDEFVGFSKVSRDSFWFFFLASRIFLFLCDQRSGVLFC